MAGRLAGLAGWLAGCAARPGAVYLAESWETYFDVFRTDLKPNEQSPETKEGYFWNLQKSVL